MEEKRESVAAVVVTYNRKELMAECLAAILGQTLPADEVIVIDNACADGTRRYLGECGLLQDARVWYVEEEENLGGAGGFREGVRLAEEAGHDWIWLMDDDVIPAPDCLEALLKAKELLRGRAAAGQDVPETGSTERSCESGSTERSYESGGTDSPVSKAGPGSTDDPGNTAGPGSADARPAFLASCVYGPGGEAMNVPELDASKSGSGYPDWYRRLEDGLVRIRSATFVSILISAEAVRRCGLPCAEFVIWGDDKEYTRRLTTAYGSAWMVGASRAVHKRALGKTLHIRYETDPARIPQYRYLFRNRGIIARYYRGKGWEHPLMIFLVDIATAFRVLKSPYGARKCRTVLAGVLQSLFQYGRFRRAIDGELRSGER